MKGFLMIIPDEFFQTLEMPDHEKVVILTQRKRTRERFEQLTQQCIEKVTIVTTPDLLVSQSTPAGDAAAVTAPTVAPVTCGDNEEFEIVKRYKRPVKLAHLRCVSNKTRKGLDGLPERCRRANKMSKDSTPQESLDLFPQDGNPSDLLYCSGHDAECGYAKGAREAIEAMIQ